MLRLGDYWLRLVTELLHSHSWFVKLRIAEVTSVHVHMSVVGKPLGVLPAPNSFSDGARNLHKMQVSWKSILKVRYCGIVYFEKNTMRSGSWTPAFHPLLLSRAPVLLICARLIIFNST